MGNGPIFNAGSVPLSSQAMGTVPQMSGALDGWLQPMVFSQVTKDLVNYEVVETMNEISFQGVWQPYSFQMLKILKEGERYWKWFTTHTKINLNLIPDDVVQYRGVQYRVMQVGIYPEYGFYEYHLVEDYTGAGPTVVTP